MHDTAEQRSWWPGAAWSDPSGVGKGYGMPLRNFVGRARITLCAAPSTYRHGIMTMAA